MRFAIKAKDPSGEAASDAEVLRDALDKVASYKALRFTDITMTDTVAGEIYTEWQIFVPNFRLRGAPDA
jgi:hypothetical protein